MCLCLYYVFILISGDFGERQFDDGQFDEFKFDALQIWRKVQFGEINLTNSTIWRNKFDEKYNLTKYFWRRTIWRNIWNCLEIFRRIVLFTTNICWILLFVKFISSNCLFDKLYFSSNFFRQIVLFVKFISPNCTFRQICKASNLNSSNYPSSNCISSKSPEIFKLSWNLKV